MDSTMVIQLTHLAGNLGVQAKTVLVWYLAAQIGSNVLWALVVAFTVMRVTGILRSLGYGQAMVQAVQKISGSNYPTAAEYARAIRLIVDGWGPKKPGGSATA